VSTAQINLSWADNANDETGFWIESCAGTSCTNFVQLSGSAGANATSFQVTGLTAGTTYRFQTRAYNAAGNSSYSNVALATTLENPPAAPTNLAAQPTSTTQIQLTWTDNASNETGFHVEMCTGASCTNFVELAGAAPANATGAQVNSLSAGTTYRFQVRAFHTTANSNYSNIASATPPTPPATPTNLAASAAAPTRITLSWTDNATTETGYRIERCFGASCTTFIEVATVGANTTFYANTGLTPNTSYSYRVRAYTGVANSGYSNTATAITPETVPVGPSGLATNVISSSRIDLSWIDNATNETEFLIERCTGSGCTTFTQIATVGPNVTVYQNTGLGSPTTYRYRVRAHNTAGYSLYSNIADGTTPQIVVFPGPTNLTATTVSSTQINLAWVDRSGTETGFEIERCSGVNCTGFALFTTVGANVTSYQNLGLVNGTSYTYRVRAYTATAKSNYSNTATAVAGTVISTTRFQNNAVWAVISLIIDGVQRITVPGTGIAPGNYFELPLTPGTHQSDGATGYWDGNSRFEVYTYSGPFTQVAGVTGTITFEDPTIAQILTNFKTSRLWDGEYWDSNYNLHVAGFRFYSGGTCRLYDDGIQATTCTFSLVSYSPGFITFRVRYANGQQFDGTLDELGGYFFMNNGPASWRTIQYTNSGQP
jgi:titin